jgi:DNA polymerase III subunit gamma/tau
MSEQFVVSALKYRPQRFDTVVGQSHITTTIKNAIKTGHLAHSFLFCGPRGVGKTTCARILAKTINCTQLTAEFEACDTCDSCVAFNNNTSFNIHELDAASNNSVEDIRQLTETVRFAPQAGSKYKVYIIDEVHMLSQSAFNAFLKTLEEPPSYAIFILATTEKHKILPTILSRCQIFDFKRITTQDVVSHLKEICTKEVVSAEDSALHFIALKSEGCMRDALSIMDKLVSFSGGAITYENTIENLNILDYDYFFKLTESVATTNISEALLTYDIILSKGFEGDTFLNGFAEHFRNLLMCKDQKVVALLDVAPSIKNKYFTQANEVAQSLIINALSILNQSELQFKAARNKRLHVELALIKLCHLPQAIQIISGDDGLAKKKVTNNKVAPLIQKVKPSLLIEVDKKPNTSAIANEPLLKAEPVKISVPVVPAIQNTDVPASYGASLKDALLAKQKANTTLQELKSLTSIELSTDSVQQNWQTFINTSLTNSPYYKKSLAETSISHNELIVTIIYKDKISYDFINKSKFDITKYFHQAYNRNDIEIQYKEEMEEVIIDDAPVKTTTEKYLDLLKTYPLLKN